MAGTLAALLLYAATSPGTAQGALRPYNVEGDEIASSLTGKPGDAEKGAALITDRHRSLCILCHSGPFPNPHLQGTLAPDLSGVGGRLSEGQIRLRVVDMKALNPASLMPTYFREADAPQIAAVWRGKPLLGATEIEDIVAYLMTLKD